MKDGDYSPSTTFDGGRIKSYFLAKKSEKLEHKVSKKTRESLFEKGLIDKNDDVVLDGNN